MSERLLQKGGCQCEYPCDCVMFEGGVFSSPEDVVRMLVDQRDMLGAADIYQERAVSTAIYPEKYQLVYPVLGLNGEAGEIAEKVKKMIRDDGGVLTPERQAALLKEFGDAQWYLAVGARDAGFTLSQVMRTNLAKLAARKNAGMLSGSGDDR